MSLEQKIDTLNNTIEKLIATLEQMSVAPAAAPIEQPAPKNKAPAKPVEEAKPQDVVVEEPPAPQPVVSDAPFTDASGMTQYVMQSYKALGSKGIEIQTVLNNLGYTNINDVKPEHYGQLYAGVEALK
jgi:hypothetical protein